MAIQQADGVHNSLGSVIYYMRNGKKCMRLKPAHYNDAKTPKQVAHREKMRLAAQFTRTCKKFLNIGYQDSPVEMGGATNKARSYILKNCFDSSGELPTLDYSKILISRGLIAAPELISTSIENGLLNLNWKTPVKGDGTKGDDKVMVMFYTTNGAESHSYCHSDVAERSSGKAAVSLPYSADTIYGWMFFHNPNAAIGESKKKISDSVFFF